MTTRSPGNSLPHPTISFFSASEGPGLMMGRLALRPPVTTKVASANP